MYTNIYIYILLLRVGQLQNDAILRQAQKSLITYMYHTRKTRHIFRLVFVGIVLQKLITFLLPLPSAVQAKEMKGFI